jgi:isochorismate synthase
VTLTRPATLDTLAARLRGAAASQAPGTLLTVTSRVEPVEPLALYAAAAGMGASLWLQPDSGFALVGIGEAWAARPAAGPDRFDAVSGAWSALLRSALIDSDGPRGSGPVLLGGFSFDDAPAPSALWQGFEPACLALPSLLSTTTAEGTWLTLSWRVGASPSPERMVRAWEAVTQSAGERAAQPVGEVEVGISTPSLRVVGHRPEPSAWRDSVARLAGAVGRARLDKAVLARRVDLVAERDIDVPAVLARLATSAPESTLFAVSRGIRCFVGATPERLVSLAGRELRTMAMAGSARRMADATVDDAVAHGLLRSDKEQEEHAVVVAMLREALAPLTERLDVAARPEIVRLRHVQHLVTPISGRLRDDADVLALVQRLHPTPAVGGTPRQLALELIAEEEPIERGWYAAPLGWVDHRGDGEFVVALRSGVVHGREASLFAGCGIVADSDPEREWDESSAKLQALGSALGQLVL